MTNRRWGSTCVKASLLLAATIAVALPKEASAQTPPPGYQPAPYYAPPMVYAPPALPPKVLDYEDGKPVPAGYHAESHVRKGLVVGGSVMLGSLWLISSLTAAVAHDHGDKTLDALYAPCVGPFIALGTASPSATGSLALVLNGVAQTGGLAMAIGGIAAQRTVLVRDDLGFELKAAPMIGRGTYGLGFAGAL